MITAGDWDDWLTRQGTIGKSVIPCRVGTAHLPPRWWAMPTLRRLIHAHVIDQELARKRRVVDALLPAPVPAHRRVDFHVERLIERPGVGASAFVLEGEVVIVVDEKVDLVGGPLDGVDVKIFPRL